jgi:acyl dehydratase
MERRIQARLELPTSRVADILEGATTSSTAIPGTNTFTFVKPVSEPATACTSTSVDGLRADASALASAIGAGDRVEATDCQRTATSRRGTSTEQ